MCSSWVLFLTLISSPLSCCIQVNLCEYVYGGWKILCSVPAEGVKLHSVMQANKHVQAEKQTDWCQLMTGKERGKRHEKRRKINVQRSGTRQTAWERAPDAVWEGYLIDDITPLFPFFSPSCSPSFLPLTHTHTHTLTLMRTIFALSPPYPCMTQRPCFSQLRFAYEPSHFCEPTKNELELMSPVMPFSSYPKL